MPYTKPNNTPLYVHKKSNYPPCINDNVPKSINNRLSEISCDEDLFNKVTQLYQKALNDSRYTHNLQYSPPVPVQSVTPPTKKRHRNTIWYNPSYGKNVQTNIGRTFLSILDKEFPKGHPLHKIFNRNKVKVCYSCMTNLKQNIDSHNKSLLHDKKDVQAKSCNCRKPSDCPLVSNCLKESVIYQATVTTGDNQPNKTYIGLTENTFKTIFTNHKATFSHKTKRLNTELSKYIWQQKESNTF